MRNRSSLNNFLNRDRKTLYLTLGIVLVCVATLTMAYAALSTTLNITGNAEVTAASWDIHFDNIQINSGSVEAATKPTITDSKTINFAIGLEEPGDYYKFTVDIVNEGTIDAMIDSVVKIPELTAEQAKYIKYEIAYSNGEAISTKQLLPKDEKKKISVEVAYRNDITASDLPTTSTTLDLSFKMVYTQADETAVTVPNGAEIKVVSGDIDKVGSEVAIGDEYFYIISSDEDSVTMLAKYNLLVGNKYDDTNGIVPLENPTGIQDSTAIGWAEYSEENPIIGTITFSSTNYWYDDPALKSKYGTGYPAYVYDSNSNLYTPVENYKNYLENMGITIEEARLIKKEELISLGCSTNDNGCTESSYTWTYLISYWTGSADNSSSLWAVTSFGYFGNYDETTEFFFGVRPVITISKSEF